MMLFVQWTVASFARVAVHAQRGAELFAGKVFWSWNTMFILFISLGLAPVLGVAFVQALWRGQMPWDLALSLLVVGVVPVAFAAIGWRYRHAPQKLGALFYGVEMPLFFAALTRLFVLRELTAPVAWFAFGSGLGLCAYAAESFRPAPRTDGGRHLRFAGLVLLGGVTAWAAAIALLWAVPLLSLIAGEIASFRWTRHMEPAALLFMAFGAFMTLFLATLFVVVPALAPLLYGRAVAREARSHSMRYGRLSTAGIAAVALLVFAGATSLASRQSQRVALAQLAHPPSSDAERRELLEAESDIRDGLTNAYLARYRYLAASGEPDGLDALYREAFGGEPAWLIAVHDVLVAPFLYDGTRRGDDAHRAEELYEAFFDVPIQEGERESVNDALGATFDRDSTEAGLLDRDAEKVLLAAQTLTVTPHGDWAEVELHEVYANETVEQQEVLYHFTLPESAAITGLWLGDSADFAQAFPFVVAPRGAAQRVYRAEVQRRVDPALLEQIGPRQYRLRVFPVPPQLDAGAPPELHMWMRYRVFAADGAFATPQLVERRNVYWSGSSERSVHGSEAAIDDDAWLPPSLTASAAPPRAHVVRLGAWEARAEPAVAEALRLPSGKRFALIVDRSRSMERHAEAVTQALAWSERHVAAASRVDYFASSAPSRGEPPAGLPAAQHDGIIYYGGHGLTRVLEQLVALTDGRGYDAMFVLTDAGAIKSEERNAARPKLASPLWLVHLGGDLPSGYADAAGDLLARPGSGIAATLEEALQRWSRHDAGARLADGYQWTFAPAPRTGPSESDLAPIAARQLLLHLQTQRASLDALHAVAVEHRIVSPLSSMLVLVNDRQRDALRRAQGADDRFERSAESGVAEVPVTVSGVPEPEEWALIALGAGLLLIAWRRRANPLER